MKKDDFILLAIAGIAIWMLLAPRRASGAASSASAPAYTTLVREWAGWRYYSDGTVIGPDGSYYYQGQKVWEPFGIPV